mmetsp:Transcript_61744/g.172460  ORF Transcript_61744/g.172460 Transcript_61744/m.172460 type:complete len:182 (-) Transcript_61744:68-613(-)
MALGTIRVPPDTRYCAEVVVLLTTLGAKRTEYNSGKRVRDLLEIKRVHHKVIDFNRDARAAGSGEAENIAIRTLMSQGKLMTGDDDDLILPQMFIDGIFVGGAGELQGLEDDGVLEAILERSKCVKCTGTRQEPSTECAAPACKVQFQEILPGLKTIQEHLEELAMSGEYDYDDEDEEYDD